MKQKTVENGAGGEKLQSTAEATIVNSIFLHLFFIVVVALTIPIDGHPTAASRRNVAGRSEISVIN